MGNGTVVDSSRVKRETMKTILATIAIGVCMCSAMTAHAANGTWKEQFQKVSDEYLDQVYFHYSPTSGTLAGYHQYDPQLESYSRKFSRSASTLFPRKNWMRRRAETARWCSATSTRRC
jgi:hypothetical protein